MGKYGKYASDGSVEYEPTECMLTGRKLDQPYDNTVRYSVKGTQEFFRILSSQHYRVSAEQLAEWRNDYTAPEPETFAMVGTVPAAVQSGGSKKRDKWAVEPVVSSEFDAGSEKNE